jgi:hypothetical protein
MEVSCPINIICLYWVGPFRGRDFAPRDVDRLLYTVHKHIDRPYKFYCLTNDMKADVPVEKIPLRYNWPGWWSKMELHRPDLPEGLTLYLDLDSHVIRSLKPLLDFPSGGKLTMFPNRMAKRTASQSSLFPETGKIVQRYQAGVMLFESGRLSWLYDLFRANPEKNMSHFRADQDLIGQYLPDQPTWSRNWLAKTRDCLGTKEAPKEAIIVTGQPKGKLLREDELALTIPWLEAMAR